MLTNVKCKQALKKDKSYKLSDGHGLYLEVMPNGSKYWRLKYRHFGKEKRLALGVYPETTLLEAREKRDEARKLLANGIDPSAAKKDALRNMQLKAEMTFERVAREWHALFKDRWSSGHAKTTLQRLENDVFPELGKRPVSEISPSELLNTIRKIEDRGAHEMARRAVQITNQVFRYAIVTDRTERNPAADLKGALKPFRKGHYAAIDSTELPALIHAIEYNTARLYPHTCLAIKLLMLTFVRTGELIAAKWDEVDFENSVWLIPPERMKMRRPHIVPLSTQSLAILRELKKLAGNRDFILPSQINSKKHMSNNTILKALERMGYKGRMTGHGFRALAMSTIKEKLHYRHEVVDRQLAHAPANKVDAAYDRAHFLEQRTIMMQQWADYLDELVNKSDVVPIRLGIPVTSNTFLVDGDSLNA